MKVREESVADACYLLRLKYCCPPRQLKSLSYLPFEKQTPLAAPNVEQATITGIIQAMTPYMRFPKVC